MKRSILISILASFALLLFISACSEDSPTSPGGSGNPQASFDAVIASGGTFETPDTGTDTLAVDTTIDEVVGGEDFFCTRKTVSASEAPADFPIFDPNKEVIWPGNLLQGASLDQATPDPIPVGRGPGTIVLALNNGADSVSRTLNEISLSSVKNAENQILASNPGAIPSRFAFTFEEAHTREQMALALDVSFGNLTGDVAAALRFSTDFAYNRYLVKLDQSFYTMAYQLPTTKEEIFASSVTPQQLSQYIGAGNPASFISSVTYGRKFYLLIESTSSKTDMFASINASFSAAVSQGDLDASAKYVTELDNVRVKAYALGGESSDALNAITTDFEQLKQFLAQGASLNTGEPLSYVVRSLARPDQIVKVKVATEYDVVDCIPVGESVENPIVWYRADHGVDRTGSANVVTKWQNFFQQTNFDALPPTEAYGGRWISNAVTGPNLPAVRFLRDDGSSSNEGMLGFSGVNFVQTEFTMFVVARLGTQFANYPELLLWGQGTTPRNDLSLGFRNATTFVVSNIQDTLEVPTIRPVDEWQLYTIRFSQANGYEVFVNGGLDPVATAPNMSGTLLSYLGTRLGSKNGNSLYIAEFKAYAQPVTDLQRKSLDKTLLVKYGL